MPKRKTYHTRLHDRESKSRQRLLGYSSGIKGTLNEQYVASLMKNFRGITDIEVIGSIGGMFDIIYRYPDDNIRAIQVKTLVKNHHVKDTWSVSFDKDYPQDTLIVLVNSEHTRFGLISYGAIKVKTLSLGFNKMNKGIYRHNKYNTLESFKESLYRRSKYSTVYDVINSVSKSIMKEYNSLQRLSKICKGLDLSFSRNSINCNVVDCYINNQTIQCKYTSFVYGYSCRFNIHKSNGTIDGVRKIQPYNSDDPIQFFIFEIGGTHDDPEKYHGYFCIIPKHIMIEMGYLSTEQNIGKTYINISVPDSSKYHWSLKYWNNFNIIKQSEQIFTIKDIVHHRYKGKRKEFLIEWDGFNIEDNTWEPETAISHTDKYKLYALKYLGV